MRRKKTSDAADAAPAIVQVLYDPGKLSLSWIGAGIGPTTPCHVTLMGASGQFSYPATGTSTTISRDLSSGGPWNVIVSVDGGASSPSAPVITAATALQLVQNYGTSIMVRWLPAAGTANSNVQLEQVGSGQSESWTTTDDYYQIQKIVTGENWQILVRGFVTSGTATCYGPASSGPVITIAPTLVRVVNSGSDVQLVWTGATAYTRFLASLQQGTSAPQTQSVTTMSYTFPGALTGTGWKATVAAETSDQVSIGPPSPVVAVIVDAPRMLRVAYLPPALTLEWTIVPGQPRYAATLWRTGESYSQSSDTPTTSFPGPYSGDDWYCAVRAESSDEVSLGPPSSTYQPILAAPALLTFGYDGANVAITWTNAAAAGVTDNMLSITSGGQGPSYSMGTSGSASTPATLSATAAYTAMLYPTGGIVIGPPSGALTPITAPPQAVYLGYNGASLVGLWQPPAGVAPTSFQATLTADGTVVATRDNVVSPLSFDVALAAATSYAMQVRAIAGAVTGPPNAPSPGPYLAAQVLTYDGFGRLRSIVWNGRQTMAWTYDAAGNLLTQSLSVDPPP